MSKAPAGSTFLSVFALACAQAVNLCRLICPVSNIAMNRNLANVLNVAVIWLKSVKMSPNNWL